MEAGGLLPREARAGVQTTLGIWAFLLRSTLSPAPTSWTTQATPGEMVYGTADGVTRFQRGGRLSFRD